MIIQFQRGNVIDGIDDHGNARSQRPYPLNISPEGDVLQQSLYAGTLRRVVGFLPDAADQTKMRTWSEVVSDPTSTIGQYIVIADAQGDWATYYGGVESVTIFDNLNPEDLP